MNFEDIYFVSERRASVPADDFSDAESRMKGQLPESYKHWLTLTGRGEFCSHLRIASPDEVAGYVREWRENATQYEFGEERGANQTSPARLAHSLNLGGTAARDSLVYLPDAQPVFALVPDDADHLIALGGDLGDAIERLCLSSEFQGPAPFLYFDPDNQAESIVATWLKQGDKLPDVVDALLGLRLHERWYTSLDESLTTIFVKSFGGAVSCMTAELLGPQDDSPTGLTMKSEDGRRAAPTELADFFNDLSAQPPGTELDCSDLPAVPPYESWPRLPEIPESALITIRLDAGQANNADLRRILNTLEEMGMSIGPVQPRGI